MAPKTMGPYLGGTRSVSHGTIPAAGIADTNAIMGNGRLVRVPTAKPSATVSASIPPMSIQARRIFCAHATRDVGSPPVRKMDSAVQAQLKPSPMQETSAGLPNATRSRGTSAATAHFLLFATIQG